MFNIAPHSRFKFDPNRHILRQDILFQEPGAHILLKWTKTLHDRSAHLFFKSPPYAIKIYAQCWLSKTLRSRQLAPGGPLFAHKVMPYQPVIDTTIRDGLRKVLTHIGVPLIKHGFHTFRVVEPL